MLISVSTKFSINQSLKLYNLQLDKSFYPNQWVFNDSHLASECWKRFLKISSAIVIVSIILNFDSNYSILHFISE